MSLVDPCLLCNKKGIVSECIGCPHRKYAVESRIRRDLCSCNSCGASLLSKSGEVAHMICWRCQFDNEVDCFVCRILVLEKPDANWSHGCMRCGRSRKELLKWVERLRTDDAKETSDEDCS